MSVFAPYLKALAGFAAAVLTNAATDLMTHQTPWPTTWWEGLRWLVSVAGTTWLVYRVPNKTSGDAPGAGRHEKR